MMMVMMITVVLLKKLRRKRRTEEDDACDNFLKHVWRDPSQEFIHATWPAGKGGKSISCHVSFGYWTTNTIVTSAWRLSSHWSKGRFVFLTVANLRWSRNLSYFRGGNKQSSISYGWQFLPPFSLILREISLLGYPPSGYKCYLFPFILYFLLLLNFIFLFFFCLRILFHSFISLEPSFSVFLKLNQ